MSLYPNPGLAYEASPTFRLQSDLGMLIPMPDRYGCCVDSTDSYEELYQRMKAEEKRKISEGAAKIRKFNEDCTNILKAMNKL